MSPQDLDQGIQMQATHEGQVEMLRRQIDTAFEYGRISGKAEHEGQVEYLRGEIDYWKGVALQRLEMKIVSDRDCESLERLYARAIDTQVTLEQQVTRLQTESTRQTEEIRALKISRIKIL